MTSRLIVDLGAIAANYAMIARAAAPATCGAVVKAEAYGLGADRVGVRLAAEGCRHFFVADVAEASALRAHIGDASLYVFAGATTATTASLLAARAVPVLNHAAQLDCWRACAAPAAVHVDTGMNRLGFPAESVTPAALAGIDVVLLLTHLACADEPDHPLNAWQLARFAEVAARFPGVPTSIGNSAAALSGGDRCGTVARPGIALYGGNPFASAMNPMQVVATLEAEVLQLREVAAGDSVGYGATWTARERRLVATVGAGYAQGVPRLLSSVGEAFVHGHRVPYVGRVSMDLTTLDVTAVADRIAVGDWVELLGRHVPLEEVAALARTIDYEVLTGLGARVPRIWRG